MISLHQPSKVIWILGFIATILFIRLPWWFIYYSLRSNRPRKSWSLKRTVNVQLLRKITLLPMKFGLVDKRNLSLEVPQKELESLNARFVWVPELEKEDLVGPVAERATRAHVKSIAIPAYWILKQGSKWSPEYDKAQEGEKVILYFHGGAFVVCSLSLVLRVFVPTSVSDRDRLSISPDSGHSKGVTQIFDITFQSAVRRLPTQLRVFPRVRKPIPICGHRRNRGLQVSRL